jgi:hypothetical protein
VVQCPRCQQQNKVPQKDALDLVMPLHPGDPRDEPCIGPVSLSDVQAPNQVPQHYERPRMPEQPEDPEDDSSAGRVSASAAQPLSTQPMHSPRLRSEPPALRPVWRLLLAAWRRLFNR